MYVESLLTLHPDCSIRVTYFNLIALIDFRCLYKIPELKIIPTALPYNTHQTLKCILL